jgi:predicted O-methyltransferase YrrM
VRLHAQAKNQERLLLSRLARHLGTWLRGKPLPWSKLEPRLSDLSLAMDVDNGIFCYLLARALQARRIVEFGTSFGISTIYLALAVRDNGGGQVIATEWVPEKAERALAHFRESGVDPWIDLRVGNAIETLQGVEGPVDLLINDGFPRYCLPVLELVKPALRPGAVVLCGNSALFPADHADYVRWVRDPGNGFRSAKLKMKLAGEFSVRV